MRKPNRAGPEPWVVRETEVDLTQLGRSESIFALSNGHIGWRANLDEGEPHAISGSYLNAVYEEVPLPYAEETFGYPEAGQAIVNVTNGKIIRLLVDDEPFDIRYGDLISHERVLDLKAGVLTRTVDWESPTHRRVRVRSTRLVSLVHRAVAAIRYEVEPVGSTVDLVLQSELVANEPVLGKDEADPRSGTLIEHPLEADEAKELAIAAGESLDDETAERIARQAGGNPFFIVETTGMLLQRHEAHDIPGSHSHLLPLTVQAVVSSRIDHLRGDARDLLRKASVFGRSTFSKWELSQVAEPNSELIQMLEDEEFLVRDPDREGVWRFRHDMLRDVAYESLAKRDRQRFHVQVADAIESSDESDRYPQDSRQRDRFSSTRSAPWIVESGVFGTSAKITLRGHLKRAGTRAMMHLPGCGDACRDGLFGGAVPC